MPTDRRPQDTEAIRAARERVAKEVERVHSFESESTTRRLWVALPLADASADLLVICDRLVARLEAAKRVIAAADDLQAVGFPLNADERTEWHNRRGYLLGRLEEWAALAAAAPGETTEPKP